jgi:preprotein translocase SecE subunit
MARNRQRAKQRQAERRAKRLAEQGRASGRRADQGNRRAERRATTDSGAIPGIDAPRVEPVDQPDDDGRLLDDPTTVDPSPAVPPELATGAPPQDEGRSDTVIGDRPDLDEAPPLDEEEALEEIEDWELEDPEEAVAGRGAGEEGYEVRGRRGREAEAHKDRPRVIQFLIAVWAELQRVQWPNRQALVTLTGVVLGFVLIAGGYLGLLDAIFSEVIQAIL